MVVRRIDMKRENILKKVVDLVAEKLVADVDKISEETNFSEDLNADSIDLTDFIMELETEFDIEIPDEDLEKLKTVRDSVDYIQKQL